MITIIYIFSVVIYLIYDFLVLVLNQLCDKERELIFLELFYTKPFEYSFNYYQVIFLIVIGITVGTMAVWITSPNRFAKNSKLKKVAELFFTAGDYPFYDNKYYVTVLLYDMDQKIMYYGNLRYLSNIKEVYMEECLVFTEEEKFTKIINDFKNNKLKRDKSVDIITFNISKNKTLWMYEEEVNA
ncbi:MAG: hypothetical protein ACK5K7_02405 [Bacilli bacterium]